MMILHVEKRPRLLPPGGRRLVGSVRACTLVTAKTSAVEHTSAERGGGFHLGVDGSFHALSLRFCAGGYRAEACEFASLVFPVRAGHSGAFKPAGGLPCRMRGAQVGLRACSSRAGAGRV